MPNANKSKIVVAAGASAAALAISLAMHFEGLSQKTYADAGKGIITACYGHTGKDVRSGETYSLEQCKKWLTNDMAEAVRAVNRCAPGLPDPILAAFADAAFNLGPTIACDTKASTAARFLASGRLREACDQLPRWDKARVAGVLMPLPGLTRRRATERELCLKGLP